MRADKVAAEEEYTSENRPSTPLPSLPASAWAPCPAAALAASRCTVGVLDQTAVTAAGRTCASLAVILVLHWVLVSLRSPIIVHLLIVDLYSSSILTQSTIFSYQFNNRFETYWVLSIVSFVQGSRISVPPLHSPSPRRPTTEMTRFTWRKMMNPAS